MITPDGLRSVIVVNLKNQQLRVVDVVVEENPFTNRIEMVTVHGMLGDSREGVPYTVSARIRVPARKRSHPEVTMLMSPFSRSLADKVKTAIWDALESSKSDL